MLRSYTSRAVPQLTRWQVERSAHRAVDDTGLEAGVRITKRDSRAHDTLAEVWCTYSGVVCCEISAGLQPGCLCRWLEGLSATQPSLLLGHHRYPLLQNHRLRMMAPNLAASQRRMIHDMILSNELTAAQMTNAAGCSVRAVKYIRSNLRAFGSIEAP